MSITPETAALQLHATFCRQAEANCGYVGEFSMIDNETTLDGHFDLVAAMKEVLDAVEPGTAGE